MANSSYVNILFTALGGIDGSVMPIIWFIAASILTVTFLWGVYDAFVRGGDVRSLGITMLKYAAVALVLMNWSAVFRDLVKSFDYVSNYIYGTNGLGDVIDAWTNGLGDAWRNDGMASWSFCRRKKSSNSSRSCRSSDDDARKIRTLRSDRDGASSFAHTGSFSILMPSNSSSTSTSSKLYLHSTFNLPCSLRHSSSFCSKNVGSALVRH